MFIIERLIKSIRDAAAFNLEVQAAPACILRPDYNRQWEAAIPRLREELPELVISSVSTAPKIAPFQPSGDIEDFLALQKKSWYY